MAEVKFSLRCLEWHVFNFQRRPRPAELIAAMNANPGMSLITIGVNLRDEKLHSLTNTIRQLVENLRGNWALTHNGDLVRLFIESKDDAMLFKLANSDLVDKPTFPAS